MKALQTNRPYEKKFATGELGAISGYAAVFNVTDSTGDVILPGAFANTLREKGAGGVRMLWQHGQTSLDPVGEWLHLEEDEYGLYAEGQLFMDITSAPERLTLIQKKAVAGLSIRCNIPAGGV